MTDGAKAENNLWFNLKKSEVLLHQYEAQTLNKPAYHLQFNTVAGCSVTVSDKLNMLGITHQPCNALTLELQVYTIVKACKFHCYVVYYRTWGSPSQQMWQTLIEQEASCVSTSTIVAHYCTVQQTDLSLSYIIDLLCQLHWFSIQGTIDFKIATLL